MLWFATSQPQRWLLQCRFRIQRLGMVTGPPGSKIKMHVEKLFLLRCQRSWRSVCFPIHSPLRRTKFKIRQRIFSAAMSRASFDACVCARQKHAHIKKKKKKKLSRAGGFVDLMTMF